MSEFAASIVLASYRLGGLDIEIPAFAAQDFQKPFEVVIADELHAQRKDALKQYLEKFPDLVVRHVPAPDHDFISVARTFNAGLKEAHGDTVVILGDYSWIPKQYLRRMVEQVDEASMTAPVAAYVDHEGPEQVEDPTFSRNAISTFVEPFDDAKLAWFLDLECDRVRRFEDRDPFVHGWLPDGRGILRDEWVLGLIALPRRVLVDQLNGFDEIFCYGRGYSDYDLVYRAERLGWRFAYNGRIIVHRVWQSKGQLIDKRSIRDWGTNKDIAAEKRQLLTEGHIGLSSHKGIEDRRYLQGRNVAVIGGGATGWVRRSVRALQAHGHRVLCTEKGHRYDHATDLMVYGVSPGDVFGVRQLQNRRIWFWWTGSDVWNLVNGTFGMPASQFPQGPLVRHLCVSERLQEELARVGIQSEVLMDVPDDPHASREESLASYAGALCDVLVYMPIARHSFYGYRDVLAVAKALPEVKFSLVGTGKATRPGEVLEHEGLELLRLPNVKNVGDVRSEQMESLILDHKVHYRPTVHDGLPYTLVECKRLGRHVVTNWPYEFCVVAAGPDEAVAAISNALARDPDKAGLRFYRDTYTTARFAQEFDRLVLRRR